MIILHADMDAFYASVEQLDRPELVGKPVIVGGLGARGVVSAASYEARPFGVRSAMPMVEARRLCPQGIFLPGRMERYVELSEEIREVFEEFTPIVEPLSLDEAFLDVTGSVRLLGPARDIARRLKARVREATGLTISVGVGPTKMVAKIASALSKPDGLLQVAPEGVAEFLRPLPVGWIWGVGPTSVAALEASGIHTIGDLADTPLSRLQARLGRHAVELHERARGHDPRTVEAHRERKSVGEENTFARDLRDGREIRETIIAHAEAVGRRLRRAEKVGRTVTLKATLSRRPAPGERYPALTRRFTLSEATDDGKTIADVALRLWDGIAADVEIRLIGVSVSSLEPRAMRQADLFGSRAPTRRDSLNRALDAITARFGEDALVRGRGRVERAAPTESIKDAPSRSSRRDSDE